MTASLTHIALHVNDLEACIQFYMDYANLEIVRDRRPHGDDGKRIVWLAEPSKAQEFIIVVLPNGPKKQQADDDFSHLGFALSSKRAVDEIADKAMVDGILVWPCRQEPYPVGYYCGIKDPDGNFVEFSYGQPLGPGAQKETF